MDIPRMTAPEIAAMEEALRGVRERLSRIEDALREQGRAHQDLAVAIAAITTKMALLPQVAVAVPAPGPGSALAAGGLAGVAVAGGVALLQLLGVLHR